VPAHKEREAEGMRSKEMMGGESGGKSRLREYGYHERWKFGEV
jgi:hypothetical protein